MLHDLKIIALHCWALSAFAVAVFAPEARAYSASTPTQSSPNLASLELGTPGIESVWGAQYRTLPSELINLHYDVELEPLARKLFPRLVAHVEKLQQALHFKLNRPIPLFLVSRNFGNAFVRYPDLFTSSFVVIPARLAAVDLGSSTFLYSGDEEDYFDTFAHEVMHYIEVDQRHEPWENIVGDAAYRFPDPTAWMAEAWAVQYEAQHLPFKGRMKDSFFGAFLRSGVSERAGYAVHEWDLSANNPEWRFVGAHYVVGSNFYDFLHRHYGLEKIGHFVLKENNLGLSSAYHNAFGKEFGELYSEFGNELKQSVEAVSKNTGGKVVFDQRLGLIGDLGTTDTGELVFLGNALEHTATMYRLGADGTLLQTHNFFQWLAPFWQPSSYSPLDWSAHTGTESLYYFSAQDNTDGNAAAPAIYRYHLDSGAREPVRDLPMARAAVVAPDRDTVFSLKQTNLNTHQFVLEKSSLAGRFRTENLVTWDQFASVAQLRYSDESPQLTFTAIKPGGTWAIYTSEARGGAVPKLVIDTRGQDLFPVRTKKGIYFLSDLDGKSFQVYHSSEGCLQQVSHEPYFVRSFTVGPKGNLWVISRKGQNEQIVEVAENGASACLNPASVRPAEPVPAEYAATTIPSVEESALKALVPATRVIVPRYIKDGGFGFQALLAGESPYRDWGWAALGDMDMNAKSDYIVGLALGFRQHFPFLINVNFEDSPYALADFYIPHARFFNSAVEVKHVFDAHSLSIRAIHSAESSQQNLGSSFGVGLLHSFANTQKATLAGVPQRGWAIITGMQYFPAYFDLSSSAANIRGEQIFYLPLVQSLFPTHSLMLSLSEVKSTGIHSFLDGHPQQRKFAFSADSDLEESSGFPAYSPRSLSMRGYSDVQLPGEFVAKGTVAYTIPLNFLRNGCADLLNRRWLNPETSVLNLVLYYDAGYLSGISPSDSPDDTLFLSSAGVQAEWGLWMNENHQTGVSAVYIFAKELNRAKKIENSWRISGIVTF